MPQKKMVQEWFEEHNNEFEVMAWPQIPQISIEMSWTDFYNNDDNLNSKVVLIVRQN